MLFTSGTVNNASNLGGNGCVSTVPASQTAMAGLDRDQLVNAQTIVAVGRQAKVPAYGWVVAVATAMQESGLRNLDHGDRDSLGLFQQRAGWGSGSQRMDAATAARMFYTGGQNAAHGLLQIQGWESMPLTLAAQAVQHSAFPDAYAKWQQVAEQVVADPAVLSAVCTGGAGFVGDGSQGSRVCRGADVPGDAIQLGWRRTERSRSGNRQRGEHDRLRLLVPCPVRMATGGRACLASCHRRRGRCHCASRARSATSRGRPALLPRSGRSPGSYHHVGIYDGNGNMVHAPRTGADRPISSPRSS